MALDKKINITEGQVIFNNKVNQGHSHDGIGSAKIDLSSYSIFDLVPIVNETSVTTRGRVQVGNENKLKTFIINTVQERVLNPAGITLKANTIDAQRIIVDGTITSNLLSANIVLVNNVISSSNYAANTSGWFISSDGNAEFNNVTIRAAITASTIDIGGSDSTSFHVDLTGQLWLGGSTYADAPFRLSSTGVLRSRFLYSNGSSFTTTLSSATFRSEFYDAGNDAYATYSVGPTQLLQTGYWSGTSSLLDADIRERIVYQTNGIFWDGRSAQGGTYSNVGSIAVERGTGYVRGILRLFTKDNSGTTTGSVEIYDGTVYATTFSGNATTATTATYATTAGLRSGRFLDVATSTLDFILANSSGDTVLRVATDAGVYAKVATGRSVNVTSNDLIGTTASTARLKQDIESYIFNEEAILSIEPKRFKYNEKVQGGGDDADWQYGFIAEEAVAAGLSELCGFDEGGLPDYFAYERMCVAQQQIIRTLWNKVESLEARIQTLEGV